MPGQKHESLVQLFRERPLLVAELLAVCGIAVPPAVARAIAQATSHPAGVTTQIVESRFSDLHPPAYSADLVVRLQTAASASRFIVEAQLQGGARKRLAKRKGWPLYVAGLRSEHGEHALLVVVTPYRSIERWASRPIESGHPGYELLPIVVGPTNVPRIADPVAAQAKPELAVLSSVVRGRSRDAVPVVVAAARAALAQRDELRKLYLDLILAFASRAARAAVERIMRQQSEFASPFFRKLEAKAIKKGMAQGMAQGMAEAKGDDVLRVLRARRIRVPKTMAQRVRACRDLETLDHWVTRAATIERASELFEE
jgi:hypothetical protein